MKKFLFFIALFSFLYGLDIKKIYLKSYNYEKSNDFIDAIKVLTPLYKKYPNGYTINLRLAWLFFLSKKYQNAIIHYKKALVASPLSMEAFIGLERSYLALNNFDKAIDVGTIIVKKDFYNFYGNYYLALALLQKVSLKEAREIAKKMLALYPTNTLFLGVLAKSFTKNNPLKAKQIYENILILDPNNVEANEFLQERR